MQLYTVFLLVDSLVIPPTRWRDIWQSLDTIGSGLRGNNFIRVLNNFLFLYEENYKKTVNNNI